jgi:hypothetical protein
MNIIETLNIMYIRGGLVSTWSCLPGWGDVGAGTALVYPPRSGGLGLGLQRERLIEKNF